MFVIQTPLPGHGPICPTCFHRLTTLFEQGHASPCELVTWHGAKHHEPDIAADGRSCPDFLARCDFLVDGEPVDADSALQIAPGSRFAEGVA